MSITYLAAESPPPRLEGEGQGGGVDNQRVGEAAYIADLDSPPFKGVDKQRSSEASGIPHFYLVSERIPGAAKKFVQCGATFVEGVGTR